MFASIEDAVAAHRDAAAAHQAAGVAMDDAHERIRQAEEYLRTHHCEVLAKALTLEWATHRDARANTRYRDQVNALLAQAIANPAPAGSYRLGGH